MVMNFGGDTAQGGSPASNEVLNKPLAVAGGTSMAQQRRWWPKLTEDSSRHIADLETKVTTSGVGTLAALGRPHGSGELQRQR